MPKKMRIKNGNRILCAATAVMVAVQFILLFIGWYDSVTLLVATQGSIVLVTLFGIWLSDVDMKECFRIQPISFKTFALSFAAVLCCFPIISFLNILSMFFVENAVADTVAEVYRYGLWPSMFVIALMPAIVEELLIRGVIYHSYREKSPVFAWIASEFIFGLLHMNFNQMPYAIFLGLVMVLMMEASGSIVTSMCMHFFVNGISTWSGYVSQMIEGNVQTDVTVEGILGTGDMMRSTLTVMGILCIVMIPLLCLIIFSTCKENERKLLKAFAKQEPVSDSYALPEVVEKEKVLDIWLIIALLIMSVITGLNTF